MSPTPETVQSTIAPNWRTAPLIRVIASQVTGVLLAISAALLVDALFGIATSWSAILFAGGVFAAWIGHRLGLRRWWIPIQIVLAPAAAWGSTLPIPGWVFLAIFALLALVFWNSARDRVPLYLTNRKTWRALTTLIADRDGVSFIDLGCGIGGALIYLAKMRPDAKFIGVESAPLPFLIAWSRARLGRVANLEVRYGDIWREDLSNYGVIYAFLSPAPMPQLMEKVKSEMTVGSLFISNSFVDPDVPPDETVTVEDGRQTQLHLWRR